MNKNRVIVLKFDGIRNKSGHIYNIDSLNSIPDSLPLAVSRRGDIISKLTNFELVGDTLYADVYMTDALVELSNKTDLFMCSAGVGKLTDKDVLYDFTMHSVFLGGNHVNDYVPSLNEQLSD